MENNCSLVFVADLPFILVEKESNEIKTFKEKYTTTVHQKLVPYLNLTLVNSPKYRQSIHENIWQIRYSERRLSKILKVFNLIFVFELSFFLWKFL